MMNKKSELPKYGGMEDAMIKAGIIGATGYAGQELDYYCSTKKLRLYGMVREAMWIRNLVPFLEMFFRL